jgi:DNA-binding SARP family transcriptional activator
MRFCILGPLLAETDDGTRLSLARPSQRATLAVLLLHASSQPASKNLLIDAIWGDGPPQNADTALRVRMRDVRRALADSARIRTHPAGYQIAIGPGELDAADFQAFISRGRQALDSGNPEDAARLLAQACRLWRDPPLADVPDTPVSHAAATALLEQRRDAREWLMDARLALGQHHELLSQIRAVLAADPLSEHPHVQLMLALYRCGQKVAALDAYSRLRELTTREFGQDPGPEASEMLRQILDDSPALAFRPRPLSLVAGSRPVWTPVRQLPAPPPDFTGRALLVEALARRMPGTGTAVTVLTGPPGVGKTTLALRVAHLAAGEFPDGQLYIDLGGPLECRQPQGVLGEVLRSLGVPTGSVPDAMRERAALYRSMVAGRRVLVLADNAAAAAQVRPLIPGTEGSAVLVTSSCRMADLEAAHGIEVGPLSQAEAVALLGRIAGPDRLVAEPAAAAAIVTACAGLPLALRIAGARLAASPALRPSGLAACLTAGQAGDVARADELLASLAVGDLSVAGRLHEAWRTLSPGARNALWLLAHARKVSYAEHLVFALADRSSAVVTELENSCLVFQDPDTGRYALAPLVASFGLCQPVPALAGIRAPASWPLHPPEAGRRERRVERDGRDRWSYRARREGWTGLDGQPHAAAAGG